MCGAEASSSNPSATPSEQTPSQPEASASPANAAQIYTSLDQVTDDDKVVSIEDFMNMTDEEIRA